MSKAHAFFQGFWLFTNDDDDNDDDDNDDDDDDDDVFRIDEFIMGSDFSNWSRVREIKNPPPLPLKLFPINE